MQGQTLAIVSMGLSATARAFARRVSKPSWLSRFLPTSTPRRLAIAPKQLRTPDPTAASEMLAGRFYLGGKMLETEGQTPFSIVPAPDAWRSELHAFQWLGDLASDGSHAALEFGSTQVMQWVNRHFSLHDKSVWHPRVASRRLIAWFAFSVHAVERLSEKQYQAWLKSIGFHIQYLRRRINQMEPGLARMEVRIALAFASLCTDASKSATARTFRLLDEELTEQIDAEGCHVSRNPRAIVDILALLLPLRQTHARLGIQPSQTLVSTIDRMMVALKLMRMGDGNLARFNGTGVLAGDLVSAVLRYDDSPKSHENQPMAGGYRRLIGGDTLLICDTGRPPTGEQSIEAHAGTLSFELSSGPTLVMVNCGAPSMGANRKPDEQLYRATAAHNTLTIGDTSSSRIHNRSWLFSVLRGRFIATPKRVTCKVEDAAGATGFTATHDGYRKPFGLMHHRSLFLSSDGTRLLGHERVLKPSGEPATRGKGVGYAVRFHLHPTISAGIADDGSVLLMAGRGLAWRFTCKALRPEVEESIFFASSAGARRTKQIVLYGESISSPEVVWELRRETLA